MVYDRWKLCSMWFISWEEKRGLISINGFPLCLAANISQKSSWCAGLWVPGWCEREAHNFADKHHLHQWQWQQRAKDLLVVWSHCRLPQLQNPVESIPSGVSWDALQLNIALLQKLMQSTLFKLCCLYATGRFAFQSIFKKSDKFSNRSRKHFMIFWFFYFLIPNETMTSAFKSISSGQSCSRAPHDAFYWLIGYLHHNLRTNLGSLAEPN